jgi:UDP-glucose:(heptosyl)LPS alpha-1,3-glucosyltransferase
MLIVANNFQLKGISTLLRALALLRARNLPMRLLIVGGKRLGSWQRMAERLGVAAAVQFVGPVENTLPYYAAADIYAHPTIYDTCSLVVLEAAACGLPIVTTQCNGAAELLHDGVDCLLFANPGDAEQLAGRVQELTDPAARRMIGEAARRTALQHTFDKNVSNILVLYEEVMENRARLAGGPSIWEGRVSVRQHAAVAALRRELSENIPQNAGVLP